MDFFLRTKLTDFFFKSVFALSAFLTLLISVTVLFVLGKESFLFFQQVPLSQFLFGTQWTPLLEPQSFGVLPLVGGTLLVVVLSLSLAFPLGLTVAVCLSEFAHPRIAQIIKPVLEILAGIPTVVYGLFALTFVTPFLKNIFPQIQVFNALSAALVMAIMILPMIIVLCDDALKAVPVSLKQGAYALGGSDLEVITGVLLPACGGRVVAAGMLAVSRAIGETMIVTLAAGALPQLTWNPLESIQTMTAYIVQVSLGDTPAGGIEYASLFAVGILLFFMTFVFNFLGSCLIFYGNKELE